MAKKEETAAPEQKSEKKSEPAQSFNLITFLKGTREELEKVVWPSRQQLISESVAVILMVTLSAALIYLIDQFFGWVAGKVFG